MPFFLAYAENTDDSLGTISLFFIIIAAIAGAALLALLLYILAFRRKKAWARPLGFAALLWAILAASSVIYSAMQQSKWEKEHTLLLQTGYLDPSQSQDKPTWPVPLWIGLAAGYATLCVVALK